MGIESRFDIRFVAAMALREKQVQQNYRPVIAVHKWFARRPGSLFRALLLSEFSERSLEESYFRAHDFTGRKVADPFMGGGTPLLEANRVGCDVFGRDIHPMAAWIVREELETLDTEEYGRIAAEVIGSLERDLGARYRTDCPQYGDTEVPVKYFLWVKVLPCERCAAAVDLFPGYLLADDRRHTAHVIVCSQCGSLNERPDPESPGACDSCSGPLILRGPARRGRCACPACGHANRYPRREGAPIRHRMFAIEYYNPQRAGRHRGRFFKRPDERDLARYREACSAWEGESPRHVPEQSIPAGDETGRLHRWGYHRYRDLFNERQLLGLERSARAIAAVADPRMRRALATNLSDLLRYQNLLCRYDASALKSLDIFSVHGFPVGLTPCESNLLGVLNGKGRCVGSGGWRNIAQKYRTAKQYCDSPYEVDHRTRPKTIVPIRGEWIGEHLPGNQTPPSRLRGVSVECGSSTDATLPPKSVDAVFTDPPYYGNVQYGELMDFCYVWLRSLARHESRAFEPPHSLSSQELTGNRTSSRDLVHYTEGLARVFRRMAAAMKVGAPLAFTFHHNSFEVYAAIGVAILDAGLTCTAAFPCPAEMSGSIHIRGTRSSILDTVFVCRAPSVIGAVEPPKTAADLEKALTADLDALTAAGLRPTPGDIRCLTFGRLTAAVTPRLVRTWDSGLDCGGKLARVEAETRVFGDPESVARASAAAFEQLFAEPRLPSLFPRSAADAVAV